MARHVTLLLTAVLLLAGCEAAGDTTAGGTGPQAAGQAEAAPAVQQAAAAQGAASVPEGVTVTGHGRVTGEPDTLRATVGVEVVRPDVDEAFEAATAAAEAVLDALRERGVADDDIQTREFAVHPQRQGGPEEPPEITGYMVRNLVEVTVREVDQAGDLLAAVADAAGDDARVQGLRWSLEDNEAQLVGAREQAFEDARAKAEHYAELAGVQLGELVSVTEVGAQLPPPQSLTEEAFDAEGAAPPIAPGEQEVGVRLQATWALE